MGEWAVLWGGLTIFGIIPGAVLLLAYWHGADLEGLDDEQIMGAMDVDERYKRFKDQ